MSGDEGSEPLKLLQAARAWADMTDDCAAEEMTGEPQVLFVRSARVPEHGEVDVHLLLVRTSDGTYRKANGADLIHIHNAHPNFVRVLDRGEPD